MYEKYQTDALIVSSREAGESDRTVAAYTKDFGLVFARASAARTEKSRMRYALQHYSLSSVALVKGKRGWRAAGARNLRSAPKDMRSLGAIARISELLIRLVHGEEPNAYLFAALAQAHETLSHDASLAPIIEIVCVARMLYALGYISTEALETALFTHTAYTGESLVEAHTLKDKLLTSINRAISQTHL